MLTNKMKKLLIIIMFGFLSTPVICQNDNMIKWQNSNINIDGNMNDWVSQPRFYENDTKLAFDMRNDSNNLYLIFKVIEQKTQFKIARAGMSISFKTKIKPKRNADIVFSPFILDKPEMNNKNIGEKRELSILKQRYLVSPAVVLSSGFTYCNGNLTINKNNSILYSVAWDTLNFMYMEYKIPLRELFGENYDLKKITKKNICLMVRENAIENPGSNWGGNSSEMNHQGEGGGGYHHGGGEGKGGGYHHDGGNNPGGMQDKTSMFEVRKFKQKFKLNGNLKS